MKTLVLNDLHLGCHRVSGTTPESREDLRTWVFAEASRICFENLDKNLLILGDLFDGFSVDTRDVQAAIVLLHGWLEKSQRTLILVAGNHDWSPKGNKLSSFHLLSSVLTMLHPTKVTVVDERPVEVYPRVLVVPHAPNQEVFNLWLGETNGIKDGAILLHANCMSRFSEDSLHSLNVSEEQLDGMREHNLVVFAHEHIMRTPKQRVVVIGNNVPSATSDLIGADKFYLVLEHGE